MLEPVDRRVYTRLFRREVDDLYTADEGDETGEMGNGHGNLLILNFALRQPDTASNYHPTYIPFHQALLVEAISAHEKAIFPSLLNSSTLFTWLKADNYDDNLGCSYFPALLNLLQCLCLLRRRLEFAYPTRCHTPGFSHGKHIPHNRSSSQLPG